MLGMCRFCATVEKQRGLMEKVVLQHVKTSNVRDFFHLFAEFR